jgi:hypothetical protein
MDPVSASLLATSVIGGLASKGKKNKIPWEVANAWDQLREFGMTGKLGNYQAGADYGGPLGNFDKSAIETQGQTDLMSLLQSGRPELFDAASGELKSLLTTDKYDPFNEKGIYSGFAADTDRATREASDALKRSTSFSGSLFSRDTMRRLGDLQEQGARAKTNKLAELYDTFAQRRLSAVPLALQAGQAQESLQQGRIASAFNYGGLDRSLADAEAKASYQDFLRKQSEKQAQIGALQSVGSGYPTPTYQSSPYEGLFSMLGQLGAYKMFSGGGVGGGGYASTYGAYGGGSGGGY